MNEIVTFGHKYDLEPGIKVFIKSASKQTNNITVLSSNLTPKLISFLKSFSVNIVDVKDLAKQYKVNTTLSPYTLKVIYFYLYCKHISKATNVYLCDFTDVFIQKDVFELIKDNKPYVSSENFVIENCETNTTWLNVCYNQDIYNILRRQEILNGGSILGRSFSVTMLLKEMCNDMMQIISRIGNYQNIDQASLIKTVYFDKFHYNILSNEEILNMAHNSDLTDLRHPYVIHQYDVNKELMNKLFEKHD